MAIATLVDRVKITVLSSGTGPFVLGGAVPAYRGVEALVDGATYSYATESGSNFEVGTGLYSSGTGQLVRTPIISSNGGAAVNFPVNIQVDFTVLAQDIAPPGALPIVQTTGPGTAVAMSQNATTTELSAKYDASNPAGYVDAVTALAAAVGAGGSQAPSNTTLAASDGAALIGGDDGSSGSLWTNLQGFVNYLLSSAGSSLLGFIQTGTGAIARTAQAELREWFRPQQYGAAGDGTTDDRTALFNADAAGPVILTANYRVGSNLTFTKPVSFVGSGRLTIDGGVTVTFAYDPLAPERQIFYGTGSVAGLGTSKAIWFAGDNLNTTTDSLTLLQKGADACVTSGFYKFPTGFFTITGSTAISLTKGQKVEGNGPFTSEIRYSSTTSNVFAASSTVFPSVKGMSFNTTNTTPPTAGTVLAFSVSYSKWENVTIRAASTGIACTAGVGHKGNNFEILDAMNIGLQADSINDLFISQFEISAPSDWITMTGVSGTFVAGETVTGGTSGATGTVTQVISSTVIKVQVSALNFTGTETITGGTSGATGSFSSQNKPHNLGGIRMTNKVEAFVAEAGDIIGGNYGMTTDATVNGLGTRPAYNKFTDVYFDSSDNGVLIDKVVEFDFIDCWFSNRPNNGVNLSNCDGVRFIGGGALNNYNNGVAVNATAVRTVFKGFAARGNSVRTANTYHGIAIAANTNDFVIQGCTLGGAIGFGTQAYGAFVNAGTSDRYIIADNLVNGNGTGGVSDGGTGANKRVANNY